MKSNNFTSAIPIRFEDHTTQRLKKVARRFRISRTQLIRQAVDRALPEWEKSGQLVILSTQAAA